MFNFSKIKRPNTCPVSEDKRVWLEKSFLFLVNLFGESHTQERNILIPHYSHFPIKYNGTESTAFETLRIICHQMEIPFEQIELSFYDEAINQISTGGISSGSIFLKAADDDKQAGGLYWGKGEHGKYDISMVRSKLNQPENMVAILAHELAHIKLLDEKHLPDNDEKLTDLTTVIFGLGVFNANAAFQTFTNIQSYGWRKQGYLSQMEWGYALSLFAHFRKEKSPKWTEHLTLNVKGDFIQGQNYIKAHSDLIFKF